jgi:5'-3' exonuclease
MEDLHKKLLKYINNKKLKIQYIYSSYHTSGEGEHKILQDIKTRKEENETYVIYGLDADLIFLSLATQKNNIYLLREDTEFGNKSTIQTNDDTYDILNDVGEQLTYVSIDELKKCISDNITEIIRLKSEASQLQYDGGSANNFINDFILLCYFLGNDFIPNLPASDIKNEGLNLIIDVYAEVCLFTNANLINNFKDNLEINTIFLDMILEKLSKYEDYYFKVKLPKYKDYVAKRRCQSSDPYEVDIWNLENLRNMNIDDPIKLGSDKPESWKFRYYEHYFNSSEYQRDTIDSVCKEYINGLVWTMKYYFDKCASWNWQYPYVTAPFVSDLYEYVKRININDVKFNLSEPLNPCVQLLAVLPSVKNGLLPNKYREFVTSSASPIIDLYPNEFTVDMIGKDSFFKCQPIIPIADIDRIKAVIKNIELSKEEKERNEIYDNIVK